MKKSTPNSDQIKNTDELIDSGYFDFLVNRKFQEYLDKKKSFYLKIAGTIITLLLTALGTLGYQAITLSEILEKRNKQISTLDLRIDSLSFETDILLGNYNIRFHDQIDSLNDVKSELEQNADLVLERSYMIQSNVSTVSEQWNYFKDRNAAIEKVTLEAIENARIAKQIVVDANATLAALKEESILNDLEQLNNRVSDIETFREHIFSRTSDFGEYNFRLNNTEYKFIVTSI